MESRNLAIVFWPTLAPPEVASIDSMARSMNMCLFVQTYIEHCEELFKDDWGEWGITGDRCEITGTVGTIWGH